MRVPPLAEFFFSILGSPRRLHAAEAGYQASTSLRRVNVTATNGMRIGRFASRRDNRAISRMVVEHEDVRVSQVSNDRELHVLEPIAATSRIGVSGQWDAEANVRPVGVRCLCPKANNQASARTHTNSPWLKPFCSLSSAYRR